VAPAVDTLTVLCSFEGQSDVQQISDIQIYVTGKLNFQGFCEDNGSKFLIQAQATVASNSGNSLCCVHVSKSLTSRYRAEESTGCAACSRSIEKIFLIQTLSTAVPAVDTLTMLCSGEGPSDVQKHGTGKIKFQDLCKGYGSKIMIQARTRLLQQ
jgi:hypothetical protein